MKQIQLLLLLGCIMIGSCSPKTSAIDSSKNIENKRYQAEEGKPIDNEYTQIVLPFCDEIGKHKFTDKNTYYFDLSVHHGMECFVFASELVCGDPSGSCGLTIRIFQKINNQYQIVYETCGLGINRSIESNFGYYSFSYNDRHGRRYKALFNGKTFDDLPLLVNNLDYDKIKIIAELTDRNISSFIVDDPTSADNSNYRVNIEKIKIGRKSYGQLFVVKTPLLLYFLFHEDRLVFWASDILSLELLHNDTQEFYDIRTYSLEDYKMMGDTSYLVPKVYKYATTSEKYE
ncbi:MAG: hypothetical protein JNM36_08830 [Chitinophagales bacterium]|nr:hypothetical protein [Chitinophagales bacterium]